MAHAFENPSGEPSPTTSEEDQNIPDLIDDKQSIPIEIEEDIQEIEDEIWVPPLEQLPTHRHKRRYTQFVIERHIEYKRNRQAL